MSLSSRSMLSMGIEGRRQIEAFDSVLRRLRDGSNRYFGTSPVTLEPVACVVRPFSDVLQIRVRAGAKSYQAFVKIFKIQNDAPEHVKLVRERVAQDFATTDHVHRGLAAFPGLSAVRPIACFPDELALVTESAPGETLASLLERRASWRPNGHTLDGLGVIVDRVGAWLRAFQSIDTVDRRLSLDEMREYLDIRLVKLQDNGRSRFTKEDRGSLLRYFDACSREVSREDLKQVRVHADLGLGNVLVDGTDVTVIDFAMSGMGAIYHDLARLFTQLEFLKAKPRFRPRLIERLQQGLLHGFDPKLEPARPLFQLLVLQHTVCHLVGLLRSPARSVARAYNWYLRQRHMQWLRSLTAKV